MDLIFIYKSPGRYITDTMYGYIDTDSYDEAKAFALDVQKLYGGEIEECDHLPLEVER